jgi:hypothetical protein
MHNILKLLQNVLIKLINCFEMIKELTNKSDLELESDLRELQQQFENENNHEHITELWHIILDYQNELKKRERLNN